MPSKQLLDNRFELTRRVGAGGVGVVYHAHDRTTGRPVAVKVLLGGGGVAPQRFEREAEMLARLDHPRIVRYVAHGKNSHGEPYLAMEWLEGETLSDYVRRGKASADTAVAVGIAIAEALSLVHARGVVHRDVKPGNIMLTDGQVGSVKLLDFGLVRSADSTRALTRTDSILGTPAYMAPEQARGPTGVDVRADIYALGAVMFFAVSGRAPHVADDPITVLLKLFVEDPPRLNALGHALPAELDDLIAEMLQRLPAQRPSLDRVLQVLRGLDRSALVDSPSPSTAPRSDGLTTTERRLTCVALAELAIVGDPNRTPSEEGISERLRILGRATERFGVEVELVQPHLAAVVVSGGTEAKDLALTAARSALAISEAFPSARVVVVSGGDVKRREISQGNLAERGVKLLATTSGLTPAVWVDEATAGLLGSELTLVKRGAAFEISGAQKPNSVRTLLGKVTPCVGRDREIGTIVGVFEECVNDSAARAVLVTATAGLGKSRLRHEVTQRILASETGAQLWFARGQLVGRGSSFALLAQLLRSFADIKDGDRPELQRERLSRRVRECVGSEDGSRIAEFLGEAIGTPYEARKGSPLDVARQNAAVMGDQMLQAWEDLVGAEARKHPLCIVLEDLHWADRASLRFLDAVLGRVATERLFLLGFARPEVHTEFENLWSDRDVLELRLSPLSKKASERMVREVLGEDVKPEVAQRIVERAAGNAFFLEELIRAHVERGAEALPDSVVSTLQARLDGFTLDARQILRAGSVFGRAFWPSAILTVLGPNTTRERVDEWLRILCEREVVTKSPQSRFPGETEYVFRHSLLRDAVYATLTDRDREFSHQHAAEWLERAGETDARVLCEHYELGSDSTSATELIAKAAQKALHGSDLAAAIAYSEHGLKKLGRGPAERQARAHLAWTKSLAHLWRGENSEAALAAEDSRASGTSGSELWFKASWVAIAACGRLGDYERLTALGSALASCPVLPDAELARLFALTQVVIQGLNAAKLAFAEQVLALLPDSAAVAADDAILAAAIDRCRASHASHKGDLASCLRYTQASVARLDTAGDLRASALQRVNLGYAEILLGRWALAKEHLLLALRTSEQHLLHNVSSMAKNNLGLVLMRLGDHEAGLRIEREAIEAFARYGDKRMEAASRVYVARDLLECGDAPGAKAEAKRAVELAGTLPSLRCYAQAILGGALLVDGDSAEALRVLEEAMTTFERHGAEEGEIQIRVLHRNALRAGGREADAERAAAKTRARVEELAKAISDDELRQSFLANVPENRDALAT